MVGWWVLRWGYRDVSDGRVVMLTWEQGSGGGVCENVDSCTMIPKRQAEGVD